MYWKQYIAWKEGKVDLVECPYRHLVFTLLWQLRLPIYDNRDRLLDVLFRVPDLSSKAVGFVRRNSPQRLRAAVYPRRRS